MKNETNEQQLFEDMRGGSEMAFSSFYDTNISSFYNYGKTLTSDKDLVMDCIHDVFVKLYSRRTELQSIENCKAYFFISLKNKICDEMRHKSFISDVAVEEYSFSSPEDVERNMIEQESEHIRYSAVNFLIDKLTTRQRKALTLYYIEGRKYEDICEIMSMNYQSVRNLMYRALTKLRTVANA